MNAGGEIERIMSALKSAGNPLWESDLKRLAQVQSIRELMPELREEHGVERRLMPGRPDNDWWLYDIAS